MNIWVNHKVKGRSMKTIVKICLVLSLGFFATGCDLASHLEHRARVINNYEKTSLLLAKENRELRAEIDRLQYELETLKSKNDYLQIKLDELEGKKVEGRTLASVSPVSPENDLVKFDTYKWKPDQLLAMADKAFADKEYEKSAQFFHAYILNFPKHEALDDKTLFQAGVAAYESGQHPDWTLTHLGRLVERYPTSKFYRGAKLWTALTNLKMGHKDQFFVTVEEFRKKYRNTPEWKILSAHYEKIVQEFK